MVKKNFALIILFIMLSMVSCQRWYVLQEGGIRPMKQKFSASIYKSNCSNDLVKTDAIYKLYERYFGENNFALSRKEYHEKYSEIEEKEPLSYIRFYKNCKYSRFLIERGNNGEINKDNFNPNRGIIGVFSIENDSLMNMEEFKNIEGSGKYIKARARVQGDTIHVIMQVYNQISHKIYIKQDVPSEFLDWKPDW